MKNKIENVFIAFRQIVHFGPEIEIMPYKIAEIVFIAFRQIVHFGHKVSEMIAERLGVFIAFRQIVHFGQRRIGGKAWRLFSSSLPFGK